MPLALGARISLPALAPLNSPLLAQILHQHVASRSVIEAIRRYPHSFDWLLQVIRPLRDQVARDLGAVVETDGLTASQFLDLLRDVSPPTARPNTALLSNWRGRGLIQASRHGYLEPQRAAAVLLARRLLPTATRNWLPDEMTPREPIWWCWRQDEPTAPITTCPVPLPTDLPASTLLWVPWIGAAWLPDWAPLARGALYCGGIHSVQELLAAAQIWHRAGDPNGAIPAEASDSGADTATIRQTWVHLMTPIALARFTPIMP